MNPIQLNKVQTYLENNARPIDLALYKFHFRGGTVQEVLDELKKYQNDDGGFGNAIEPDLRLPQSTALATWAAFKIMNEVSTPASNDILRRTLTYLTNSYDENRTGWAIVRPEVDNYPHAPWWGYKAAMSGFGWGNPSAELLGFLIKYGDSKTANLVDALTKKAIARIKEVEPSDFHEIFNFKALYELAGEELRELKTPLEQLILKSASTNPNEWKEYTAPPLRFILSPTDTFAHLFKKDVINKNLQFLLESMVDHNHWEPNWDWSSTFPNDWHMAKKEWCSQLTVRNLLVLKSFKVINS
jgi:hypothetical protein